MKLLGLLPPNYVCFRCGIPGHHIKVCPANGDQRSYGNAQGFLVVSWWQWRILTERESWWTTVGNIEAYAIGKKEKLPFPESDHPSSSSSEDPVPDALLCLICKDLLTDAVMIPCCRSSYCNECIRTCLLESDGHVCPTCGQSDVSPDALTANTVLRQEVNHFKNGTRSSHSYKSPNHSRPSQSPIPESSSKKERNVRQKRSRSRSPLDQKRPWH